MNEQTKKYIVAFLACYPEYQEMPITAFTFGDSAVMADELAMLVLNGKKTGTCGGYALYSNQEELPKVGQLSVVLNHRYEPVCVIKNTTIEILPYIEVAAHHARKEGEGDLSLAYWQKTHTAFFETVYRSVLQREFTVNDLLVFETFAVVYSS